jgi:hypothetical protein
MHLHYGLLADILVELARSLASRPPLDEQHREELTQAVAEAKSAIEVGPDHSVGSRADFEAMNRAITLHRLRPVIDRSSSSPRQLMPIAASKRVNLAPLVIGNVLGSAVFGSRGTKNAHLYRRPRRFSCGSRSIAASKGLCIAPCHCRRNRPTSAAIRPDHCPLRRIRY